MKKLLVLLVVLTMVASLFVGCQSADTTTEGSEGENQEPASGEIKIGHLSYHTGPFGHVGPQFDGAANFALDLINEDPPLGRKVSIIHQDIGEIGEGQAARKLVENDNVDILLNVAGEYMSYRDWLLEFIKNDGKRPILPSVHAGAVNPDFGGTVEEPIFRGAPMDTDQGLATALQAQKAGAKTVAVMAVENDGMQMQKDAAIAACEALGMEVVANIDFQPEQTNYRSVVSKAQAVNPDALIIFCAAEDGGTIVKNAAEMGMSSIIVGATDWLFVEFPKTATMSALQKHKSVTAVGFTYEENAAWDFFKDAWENSKYADLTEASNSYVLQYYDLLNVTALAIEKAGTTDITEWVKAMPEVAMGPGKKVYTYKEGLEALRAGEDIDYVGVTGEFNYTNTGVVSGIYGTFEWKDTETLERVDIIEGEAIFDLASKIN